MCLPSESKALLSALVLLAFIGNGLAQDPGSATQGGVALNADEIVARLTAEQAANRERIRAYTVTREYRLYGDKSAETDSRVIAEISFVPPVTKDYRIRERKGSGQGERIVRKVLQHEREMAASWEETALTPVNYDFVFAGVDVVEGRRCFVLAIEPKRDSKDLIRGKAWIDATTFNVRRMAGEPAKSPSWWVKKMQLTLTFSEVEGMWLQTGAKADAEVRFFGKHVLTANDIHYRTADAIASLTH
ncbi:MAG TPA: hypothetical protein VN622_05025 [Clostridia bacterium]|nr:hypothetical protein [Clostridia bacterium]